MSNHTPFALSLITLIAGATVPLCAHAAEPTDPSITIRLRLYLHAEVAPSVAAEAVRWAGDVFRNSGIASEWLFCPTAPEQLAENQDCAEPRGYLDFVIRVLPPAMSEKYRLPEGVFGFAQPGTNGRPGRIASVFHAPIEDMAYSGAIPGPAKRAEGIILGHVLAHEVGHLILGAGSHAPAGIMSFPWGQQELLDASRQRLRFTKAQASKIRRLLRQ